MSTNCNKIGLNILVKPNQDSLTYQSVSTEFANIRSMELAGNIHGFYQSSEATNYLDNNSYLTGEIPNDSNNIDTHMIKNIEWGAIAYLSYSNYGKWANPLYTENYRRVYKNNYYTETNNVFKTGYSSGIYNGNPATDASSTFSYNDLTIAATGQGYRGAGASTTGNVYGVYDMSGGAFEVVIANQVNKSGNFAPAAAGTWTTDSTDNIPNSKYYDKYSYNTSNYSANSQMRGKLGDATREMTITFGVADSSWDLEGRYMITEGAPWFLRGSVASDGYGYGISYSDEVPGSAIVYDGSRPILAIYRDLPWIS